MVYYIYLNFNFVSMAINAFIVQQNKELVYSIIMHYSINVMMNSSYIYILYFV